MTRSRQGRGAGAREAQSLRRRDLTQTLPRRPGVVLVPSRATITNGAMKRRSSIPWAAFVAAYSTFASNTELESASPAQATERQCGISSPLSVVLIAIDGVRPQDVFGGHDATPHLLALSRAGVALGAPGHGEAFLASGPNFVSLPGYTELLTGRPAACQENDCPDRPSWTLLDAFAAGREGEVAAIASWAPIARVAASRPDVGIISAGRSGGETRERLRLVDGLADVYDAGQAASPFPGGGDYRPDAHTGTLALAYLTERRPAFLFVGLGDTDEHAHHGDHLDYMGALRTADHFVGEVMALATSWRLEGHETVIVVTTDHGRGDADFKSHGRDHPGSDAGWLIAAGGPIPARGYVASTRARHLADVAPTLAAIARVPMGARVGSGHVLGELLPECGD